MPDLEIVFGNGATKLVCNTALRKAGATIAANNRATSSQLMAIFGWSSIQMAEIYTRAADQKRLAESAMHLIDTASLNGT